MGYMHIPNLYKERDILMFKEVWALEKVHGSSAHISFKNQGDDDTGRTVPPTVHLFCGGCKKELFNSLWNLEELTKKFLDLGVEKITIYGEGYGGKMQGMSATYGKELKFVAFDVRIGEVWLDVEKAHEICASMSIDFVAYEKVSTNLEDLDRERDRPSRQAVWNGIHEDKLSEGVVLRPIIELRKNNGARIICKHKRDEFMETSKPRKVQDPEKLKILGDAKVVAKEWVTFNRMSNILSHIDKEPTIEIIGDIIKIMIEDIKREGNKEIVWNKPIERAIGKATAELFKMYIKDKLYEKKM